ncbi:MAG: Na+/H+ antiporter NhaC family protein, partial [Coriobacteriia bacterium]|nr:Na+/H+ antiporter NhaC family protein [Coriobacteriia bacterium]
MPQKSTKKTQKKNLEPKANAWALLPAIVFVAIYIATIITIVNVPQLGDYFGTIPIMPAFIITLIVALQQNKKNTFQDKLGVVGRGIGNSSIIYMILIFILAGLFAGTVGRSSASSVAYFMLDFVPAQFSVLIIFVVSCFVSLAMGTSVGSVTLMTPIAISVASTSGQDIAVCVACVICGSMFGDNLSVISDTSIAACTGIGCEPKEKFFENLKIVLPAAIISVVCLLLATVNSGNGIQIHEAYSLIDFVP